MDPQRIIPASYRSRVVDQELSRALSATGAVLIEGPRGCGKTVTAATVAKSIARLDVDTALREAGLIAPQLILAGERPRLIDEWQLVKDIWEHVRRDVDEHPEEPGRFILTGSAVEDDDTARHTGGLRYTRLRMRPMSLFESGHSTGGASLSALLAGQEQITPDAGLDIHKLVERISTGGWPALLNRTSDQARVALRGYLDQTRRQDVFRVDGIRRDPGNMDRVLRSLARNVATAASARSLAADVSGADDSIKASTVSDYIEVLRRVFVVEDLSAWSPSVRSRAPLREPKKRHFVDPSLAVAALDLHADRLLRDTETLGFLFESLVIRDLRIYAQAMDAMVLYFRDDSGLEADAIVQTADGRWAAFEVKLGQHMIDEAADNLRTLASRVDTAKHGEPAALAVVTGWGPSYRRRDGVHVISIGTLGP